MAPTFSVLMAAYNAETTIAEALNSLLAQTRGDWEAIVVDDGSADATLTIASAYAKRDSRFTVLSKTNGGTASARNLAARHASGSLFSLLDADDLYLPHYFEHMGGFIDEHPGYEIYSSSGLCFRAGEEAWPDEFPENDRIRSYEVEDMLVQNRFSVHSLFRRSAFDLVGGFDEDPRMVNEDHCFWLTAMLRGARHIHNPERLWMYRRSEGQKTSDPVLFNRAGVFLLDGLLKRGEISGSRARIARVARRNLIRWGRLLEARRGREQLEQQLMHGDLEGARRAYLASRRAYGSIIKYAVGLPVMLVSPQIFARLTSLIVARPSGSDERSDRF